MLWRFQMVSGAGAVAFVTVASAMLILLYLFLNHVFALVLVSCNPHKPRLWFLCFVHDSHAVYYIPDRPRGTEVGI